MNFTKLWNQVISRAFSRCCLKACRTVYYKSKADLKKKEIGIYTNTVVERRRDAIYKALQTATMWTLGNLPQDFLEHTTMTCVNLS